MAFEDKHHDIYDTINPLKGTANVARGATVLVTGAGRGIGRAISVAFAQAGAANLVLSARTQSQLDETEKEVHEKSGRSDVKVVKATVDVMDGKQVEKLVKQFVDAGADGGKLILINNAGYLEPIKVLGDQDPEEWLKTVRINVDGSFFTVQYLLKELKARRYKGSTHVLNTSSIGSYITMPGLSSYQPSKAFINRFTEFISADASKLGLSVTAICYHPGGIKTGLAANMGPGMDFLFTDTPELAAGTAVWLTSGQADFLDGRYVSATWDMSDLKAREKEIAEKDLLRTRVVFD